MADGETVSLGPNHRLVHSEDQHRIKYQSKQPGADWHTQANLRYHEARLVGEFLKNIRARHDIERFLEDDDG